MQFIHAAAGGEVGSDPSACPDPSFWWTPVDHPPDLNGPVDDPFIAPDAGFLDRPIFESFARIAARQPDAPALRSGKRSLTYGETHRLTLALAARIAAISTPGGGIAILFPDDIDAAIGQLACLAAGRVGLLLNPAHPLERLAGIAAVAVPQALLIAAEMSAPKLPANVSVLRGIAAEPAGSPVPFEPAGLDAPAAVIYTSGSTGEPKGFVRTQRQMLIRAARHMRGFHAGPNDRVLTLFRMTNGTGLSLKVMALLAGSELQVTADGTGGLRDVLKVIRSQQVSILCAIPTMLRTLLALPSAGAVCRSVRITYSISEAILRTDVDAWRSILREDCAIMIAYGMTEANGLASWFVPRDLPAAPARVPVGFPNPLYQFAILDETNRPAMPGEIGMLWLRSSLLTQGEWRAGQCVQGRATPDPADPACCILRTNDLVRLRPDGVLEFVGRADDMVKIRGNRVEPAEIEDALRRAPAVADVAILPLRTAEETSLVAYVVPAAEAAPDRAALLAHLRTSLPAYMMPAKIVFLSVMPRLPNGKVDARALTACHEMQQ